jgi:hypothetical protein
MDPGNALGARATRVVTATATGLLAATIVLAAAAGRAQCPGHGDPEVGTIDGSPLDDLPAHISLVVPYGQRPDWSPDGRRLLFLDGSVSGDVWTVDVATGETRNLTGGFSNHQGFGRAHFLASGDILLCGTTSGPTPTPDRPEAGRFNGVLWVLRAPFDEPPEPLGMPCWEGVAVSKHSNEIAWNRSQIDFTAEDRFSEVALGISEIWTGRLEPGRAGDPKGPVRWKEPWHRTVPWKKRGLRVDLVDVNKAIDRYAIPSIVSGIAVLEVQDFRPRGREILFTNYVDLAAGAEIMGLDRDTGELRNYSQSPCYEEAEGVFPDGRSILVERDLTSTLMPDVIDIWRLSLDGLARYERLTYFNRHQGFYASNPVAHPGGRKFAFQLSIRGGPEGDGDGILVFDLDRFTAGP